MDSLPSLAKRQNSSEYCTRRSNAEKFRRGRLSDRIACLRKALPIGLLSAKPTKVEVIDCACKFVSEILKRLNNQSGGPEAPTSCDEHEKEINRLQAYCKQLEKRCAHYASVVESSETLRFLDLNLNGDPTLDGQNQTTGDGAKRSGGSEKSCIVVYSPRVGGGKRKRTASPFKSALKCRQILPRPIGESCREPLVSNRSATGQRNGSDAGLLANACSNVNYFTLIHGSAEGQKCDSVATAPLETSLLNNDSQTLRISSAVQTEEVLNDVLSMTTGGSVFVDSATSPIVSNELNSLMETYLSSKQMEQSVAVNGEPVATSVNPTDNLGSATERTTKKDRHSVASLLQLSDLIDEQMEPVEDLFFNDKSSSDTRFEGAELICETLSGAVEQPSLYSSYTMTPKAIIPSDRVEIPQANPGQCDSNVSDVDAFPVAMHSYDGQMLNDSMHSFSSRPAGNSASVFPSIDSLINEQSSVPASYERQNVPTYKQTVSRQPANFSVEYLQQTSVSSQDALMSYDTFFGVPSERSEFFPCGEFKTPTSNVHWPGNGPAIDFWPRLLRTDGSNSQPYAQYSDGQMAGSGDGRDLNLSKSIFDQPLEHQVYPGVGTVGSARPVGQVHQFQIESMFPEVFGNESIHQSQVLLPTSSNSTSNAVPSFPWLNLGSSVIPPTGAQTSYTLDSTTCGLLPSQRSDTSSASAKNSSLHNGINFNNETQLTNNDGLMGNCLGIDSANCFL
uniref:BHLH domain-containing protein n=1 Tax=Trichuris muris TaxID=70415 RepID=A0A5S6QQK6_TRIMR